MDKKYLKHIVSKKEDEKLKELKVGYNNQREKLKEEFFNERLDSQVRKTVETLDEQLSAMREVVMDSVISSPYLSDKFIGSTSFNPKQAFEMVIGLDSCYVHDSLTSDYFDLDGKTFKDQIIKFYRDSVLNSQIQILIDEYKTKLLLLKYNIRL